MQRRLACSSLGSLMAFAFSLCAGVAELGVDAFASRQAGGGGTAHAGTRSCSRLSSACHM